MSLDFRLKEIEDYKTVCYDGNGDLKFVTEHLIFACMAVEMGEIRSDNVAEFWARLDLMYKLGYATHLVPNISNTDDDFVDLRATPEDVVAHIGLSTNVPFRSRHQWVNRADGYVKGYIADRMSDSVGRIEKLMGTANAL